MFGGLVTICIAVWFYNAAIKVKAGNPIIWVAIGVITFMAVQVLLTIVNVDMISSAKNMDMSKVRNLADGQSGSTWESIKSIYYEFAPLLIGILAAAFVRKKYLLREKLQFPFGRKPSED